MILRILIILVFNTFFFTLSAQPPILLNNDKTDYLGKYTSVLEDPSGKLTIEDIIKSNHPFARCLEDVFNHKPSASAFWVRFQVKNTTEKKFFLEINNPTLNGLDIYINDGTKVKLIKKSGDLIPFSHREIKRNNFIFSLDIPREKIITFYIRYRTSVTTGLPLTIGTAAVMFERSNKMDLLYGLFYGILFLTILYNLFLYISIRDITFLLYVFYIISFALFHSEILGHLFQFLLPNYPEINNYLPFLFSALTGIFTISFTRSFLQSKSRMPNLHKLGNTFQAIFILSVFIFFFHKVISELLISFTGLLVGPYMMTLGIGIYLQGYKPARFYILASGFAVVSLCIFVMKSQGFIPYTFFTNNILAFGVGLEAILFSLALGDRYNIYKHEKEEIQNRLNNELKLKIIERTKDQRELKKKNNSLLKINKDLDSFVYTASHDLKAPISNLEGLINFLRDPSIKDNEREDIMEMMDVSLKKLKNTILELTEISKVQKNKVEDIVTVSFAEVTEETLAVLNPQIKNTQAIVQSDFSEIQTIQFSRKYIRSILYNLIGNAIKYKSPDRTPHIFVKTYQFNNFIILSVKDNGLGIPMEQKEKIFDMFKRYHTHVEGTGVGLYLVKRIIENAEGKIEVESEPGKGTEFKIYFKI